MTSEGLDKATSVSLRRASALRGAHLLPADRRIRVAHQVTQMAKVIHAVYGLHPAADGRHEIADGLVVKAGILECGNHGKGDAAAAARGLFDQTRDLARRGADLDTGPRCENARAGNLLEHDFSKRAALALCAVENNTQRLLGNSVREAIACSDVRYQINHHWQRHS